MAAALAWHDAGCAVIPIRADGSKAPLVPWRKYQKDGPTRDEVRRWFTGNPPGLAVLCGAASRGLEMLELEGRAVAEGLARRLVELADAAGLQELWRRVAVDGYAERTPSGGVHLLYRVEGVEVGRNVKLARRPATDAELAVDPSDKIKTLAETRGEGGYTIVAPSHGSVHESRRPWVAIGASTPERIPTISVPERYVLLAIVRSLDAMPLPAPVQGSAHSTAAGNGASPGDDFERRTDWADILEPAGWTLVHQSGRTRYWRRPGKSVGVSATTGRADDRDRLWVFSSSTVFDPERSITKFHAHAVLHHGGDHAAAARALRGAGFGRPRSGITTRVAVPPSEGWDTGPGAGEGGPQRTPARVTEEAVPHVAAWGPTEDGLARALVAHHGHELRYCPQRGKWLLWVGHRWAWDDAEQHREFVRALARELPSTGPWRRFRAQALSAGGVSGVIRLARSDPAITVGIDRLDARPYELNTPGGVVDLRTAAQGPSDPALLHTRCTTAVPDFDRRSEAFDRFLADTFGEDEELAGYVQRLLGVSAIGIVLEQLLPFAVGPGANGKSTLLEAVMHALGRDDGGYAAAASAEMLMVRKHAEHPAELAQLAGARLVVCAELDEGQRFAEARVKQLTGRDSINARFMRRDPFTFSPSHTLWLLANHLPAARAGGPAFWRRIRVLPFNRVVPAERQIKRLGEILAEDGPAVLAWVLDGAAAYHAAGLREPASVTAATAAYARDQDTVGRFVEEMCRHGQDAATLRVVTTVLRDAYEQWCEQAGERPVSAKRLTQELRRFGVADARGSKGRRYYEGIALVDFEDPQQALLGRAG
ncbi:phage/plasmid primase, P4 family [Actinoplanes aureus]|uniref:Bifunctional DNA primase/polymerase n=1 Tax=Actinoplanes aureus TaxID=2792083 RepID=A0A931G167_9ACTN|nr:phage/plasmid primase, P4 family [Actinoplanes aureus]MBG0567553.1 bifunctional DNA primase/polymerase [Actinoplanes aureus]